MVLCAFAHPRFDFQENCTFDGNFGCFPFVIYEAAKRYLWFMKEPKGLVKNDEQGQLRWNLYIQ
jgi:hypothetical protein